MLTLAVALLSAHLVRALSSTPAPSAANGDTARYSYMCLQSNQDLCMGISPGDGDPVFDPNNIFYLQVKSRSGGEASNTDYKKTRWDLGFGDGKIQLSRFSDLCACKVGGSTLAGLFPCNSTFPADYNPNINYGRWVLSQFKTDPNGAGVLQLSGNANQCLTVMQCEEDPVTGFCNALADSVAWDLVLNQPKDLRRGATLRFRPCYNRHPDANVTLLGPIQVWRQKLDCAVGCPPYLQGNGVCDVACNNVQCEWDGGDCITKTPTPPTRTPTKPNATLNPTKQTTTAPTDPPTTSTPTRASATRTPTVKPSTGPTSSPSIACPVNGTLEFCGRFVAARGCNNTKLTQGRCQWCLNQCLPNMGTDKRVCQIPGFYSGCPAQCPTDQERRRCPLTFSKRQCFKAGLKACTWCAGAVPPGVKYITRCYPGRDRRVCTSPHMYDHCGTLAPTPPRACPGKIIVTRCLAATTQTACNNGCIWCSAATSYSCRPTTPALGTGVCGIDGNPIVNYFNHCPALFPSPTRAPSQPHPTRSPTTSKAPTVKPTSASPTVRTTGVPTKKPSPSA